MPADPSGKWILIVIHGENTLFIYLFIDTWFVFARFRVLHLNADECFHWENEDTLVTQQYRSCQMKALFPSRRKRARSPWRRAKPERSRQHVNSREAETVFNRSSSEWVKRCGGGCVRRYCGRTFHSIHQRREEEEGGERVREKGEKR